MSTDDTPGSEGTLRRLFGRLGLRPEPDDVRVARERREWWEPELERAVALLAADAATQRQWLVESFGGHAPGDADELALHFDGLWMEGRIQHAIGISRDARRRLDELDRALDQMSGPEHSELWTLDALTDQPEWDHVRRLASAAADALQTEFHGSRTRHVREPRARR